MNQSLVASPEVLSWIHQSVEVSSRIHAWAKKLQAEPFSALVQRYVTDFVGKFQSLAFEIISSNGGHECRPQDVDAGCFQCTDLRSKIKTMSVLNLKIMELVDFYKLHEKTGAGGALNALLAEQLMNDELIDTSKRERVKLQHVAREMADLIVNVFSGWHEGSPPDLHDPDVQSKLDDCVRKTQNMQWPRYVHQYSSLSEVPYQEDHSVLAIPGSHGIIRKVICRSTGEAFAQKTFHDIYSPVDRRKIMTELGFLELCHHRNLISFVDAYSTDSNKTIHFVTSPWAPLTLLNFVRDSDATREKNCPWFSLGSPESQRCVYRIMFELSDAVAYLHQHSIKHKDIKPSNILLHQHDTLAITPILTDVGVSKVYLNGGPTNYTDSSYPYLAPEQVGMESSTLKADIWQLGCCFSKLLATARGGRGALDRLWESFENDDPNCSCQISREHPAFMRAFQRECAGGDSKQRAAYQITSSALQAKPTARPDICTVREALRPLLSP